MGTKEFNSLDKLIAKWRLSKVVNLISKGDSIMDFGCGNQIFFLREIEPEIKIGVGYDFGVENMKIGDKIELKKLDKEYRVLKRDEKKYDKIIMLAVLEHIEIEKAIDLLNILQKKLKPNGKIILTTPTPLGRLVLEFMAYKLKIISETQIRDHKKYWSKKDFEEISDKTPLKLIKYSTFQMGMNSIVLLGS